MEGIESAGAPRAEEPKRYGSSNCWEKPRAREGPASRTSTEGPQGLGDRKRRPPNRRPEGGAGDTPVGENEWGRRSGGRGKGGAPVWAGHRPLSKSEPLPREPGEKRLRDSRTHRRSRQLHRESPS